jgi:hypothetical protein
MILTCIDFPDIRVIELVGHVHDRTLNVVDIHVECAIGRELMQEIPICNRSAQDWNVKSVFEFPNSNNGTTLPNFISGPQSVIIRANTIGQYPVYFRPRPEDVGKVITCSLVLETTGYYQQRFAFQIRPFVE